MGIQQKQGNSNGRRCSQYRGQLPSASYSDTVGRSWRAPSPPNKCPAWAPIKETSGNPAPGFLVEWINQVSLKTGDVCTSELMVGEGLGWATWKPAGWWIFSHTDPWILLHWHPLPPGPSPLLVQAGVPTKSHLAKILSHRVSGAPGKCHTLIEKVGWVTKETLNSKTEKWHLATAP